MLLLDFIRFWFNSFIKRLYLLTHKRTHPLSLFLFLSLSLILSLLYIYNIRNSINRSVRRSTRRRLRPRRGLPRSRRRNHPEALLRKPPSGSPEALALLSLEISGRGFSAKYFYPMFSKILSVIVGRSFICIGNQVAILCRVRFLSLLS